MANKNLKYYIKGAIDKAGRKLVPRYRRKQVVLFRYTNALGDALMLTTLAREVRKRNPRAFIHVISGLPALFERNPDVNQVTQHEDRPVPGLGRYLVRYEHEFPWDKHLLNHCARCVDIYDSIDLRTYVFPAPDDFEWAKTFTGNLTGPVILINRKAGPRTDKKNWPDSYWEELIAELEQAGTVVEIGTSPDKNERTFGNRFIDLRGKTTLHRVAALMSMAHLLICPVTGLLHLAAAYDLKTLCILGGSEPASATQYKNTHYLDNRPPCADCYEKGPCTENFKCLTAITPKMVMTRVRQLMLP